MARVNRLVMSGEDEAMATVLYLVLDRETGERLRSPARATRRRSCWPPTGRGFLEGGRAVPIGAVESGRLSRGDRRAPARARRCCSTRTGWSSAATSRSSGAWTRWPRPPTGAEGGLEGLCDAVLAGVIGPSACPSDDVALLAVRPRPVASGAIRFTLPAEPESLPGLRRRLGRFLHAAGADDAETYEITLTVCEAAGNAIEHAYGPGDATFDVEARLDSDELVATVSDTATGASGAARTAAVG